MDVPALLRVNALVVSLLGMIFAVVQLGDQRIAKLQRAVYAALCMLSVMVLLIVGFD